MGFGESFSGPKIELKTASNEKLDFSKPLNDEKKQEEKQVLKKEQDARKAGDEESLASLELFEQKNQDIFKKNDNESKVKEQKENFSYQIQNTELYKNLEAEVGSTEVSEVFSNIFILEQKKLKKPLDQLDSKEQKEFVDRVLNTMEAQLNVVKQESFQETQGVIFSTEFQELPKEEQETLVNKQEKAIYDLYKSRLGLFDSPLAFKENNTEEYLQAMLIQIQELSQDDESRRNKRWNHFLEKYAEVTGMTEAKAEAALQKYIQADKKLNKFVHFKSTIKTEEDYSEIFNAGVNGNFDEVFNSRTQDFEYGLEGLEETVDTSVQMKEEQQEIQNNIKLELENKNNFGVLVENAEEVLEDNFGNNPELMHYLEDRKLNFKDSANLRKNVVDGKDVYTILFNKENGALATRLILKEGSEKAEILVGEQKLPSALDNLTLERNVHSLVSFEMARNLGFKESWFQEQLVDDQASKEQNDPLQFFTTLFDNDFYKKDFSRLSKPEIKEMKTILGLALNKNLSKDPLELDDIKNAGVGFVDSNNKITSQFNNYMKDFYAAYKAGKTEKA